MTHPLPPIIRRELIACPHPIAPHKNFIPFAASACNMVPVPRGGPSSRKVENLEVRLVRTINDVKMQNIEREFSAAEP
jgi:hypothetical protein